MRAVRKRLTYANVMSSIAVFLVLAGGTAFAASQLAKNSVGAKQLKKNAVTSAKLKKNAVTGAKIKPGAVTGAKIDEGSLGTVPSANSANSANVATNLSGYSHNSIRLTPTPVSSYEDGLNNAPETTLLSAGPLSVTAKCFVYGGSSFTAMFFIKTSEDGAAFYSKNSYTSTDESKNLLNTSTAPQQRLIYYWGTGSDFAYYRAEDSEFAAAAPNGTTVRGGLQIGLKAGNLKGGGQGVFGAGNVCLMAGNMFVL